MIKKGEGTLMKKRRTITRPSPNDRDDPNTYQTPP
jgi:hypothetical protein